MNREFRAAALGAGGCSYHHCADLQITADPAKPIDAGWPTASTTVAQP